MIVSARTRMRAFATALLCVACASCGGSGGGGGGGGVVTTPPPSTSQNPCATALAADEDASAPVQGVNQSPEASRKRENVRGRTKADVRDALWRHRAQRGREVVEPRDDAARPAVTQDVGDVAVIEDEGAIFLSANAFDLANKGLRFRRNGSGYDVTSIDAAFRSVLGSRVTLGDDDSVRVDLPASLGLFGGAFASAFVNSDGNITFERADSSSTDRSVGRFLAGAPRIAAFFADLDPSAGGRVFAAADVAGLTVTWCAVPGFDSSATVNVQTTVQSDGTVDVKFGDVRLREAVVGLSPGNTQAFAPVDLTGAGTVAGGSGAVGERFSDSSEADLVVAAQRFYRTHPDTFDQLVFWGESGLIPLGEAFAQEFTVANAIQGIGVPPIRGADEFGSAGRLQSVVNMDRITKYPVNATERFLGEDSVVSLLGQESGHRWLAFLEFLDADRRNSSQLLGRDDAHWSFFFDSDASVMEGNDIEALGGGAFRSVGAVQRYSLLDQYAMGLVRPDQVPPFFYVDAPTNIVPTQDRTSAPRVGVTFNGTRRDVLIADVIASMGARLPATADAPKVWKQAWIYLVRRGSNAPAADVAKVDGWRTAWEAFFLQATDGRMRLDAKLR